MESIPCEPEHYDARQKLSFLVNRFRGLIGILLRQTGLDYLAPIQNVQGMGFADTVTR